MKRLGLVILLLAMVAVSFGVTAQLTAPHPMAAADRATFVRANQLVDRWHVVSTSCIRPSGQMVLCNAVRFRRSIAVAVSRMNSRTRLHA